MSRFISKEAEEEGKAGESEGESSEEDGGSDISDLIDDTEELESDLPNNPEHVNAIQECGKYF